MTALAIIHSADNIRGWLESGELLQHALLVATKQGLNCSFFNMAMQVPEFRSTIRKVFGLVQLPQLLLRIGYANPIQDFSPRRPLEDFLVPEAPVERMTIGHVHPESLMNEHID